MKKKKMIMAMTFVLLTCSYAHASIVWHSEFQQFNYSVNSNGGTLFQAPNLFNTMAGDTGSITNSTGSYADQVSCQHSSTPLTGVFEMKAGAHGTKTLSSPENGLSVAAYAGMNLNGFDSTSEAVDVDQWIFSNVTRNLSVTAAGDYRLEANLSGLVDFNTIVGSGYGSSYFIEGETRINKYSIDDSGTIKALGDGDATAQFFVNDQSRNESAVVSLEAKTPEGDDIFYQMVVALTLKTSLQNFDWQTFSAVEATGSAFEGPFALGDETDPMMLDASLSPAVTATPLPGTIVLLLSGLSGLGVFRRFSKKS